MTDPKLAVAAGIMGKALAGLTIGMPDDDYTGMGVDFETDEETGRVWAHVTMPTGDVYELSARWVEEKSP